MKRLVAFALAVVLALTYFVTRASGEALSRPADQLQFASDRRRLIVRHPCLPAETQVNVTSGDRLGLLSEKITAHPRS